VGIKKGIRFATAKRRSMKGSKFKNKTGFRKGIKTSN
jgi:hypothetical protein